jgi:hypothetical protein
MYFKFVGAAVIAMMFLFAPSAVEASCCDQMDHKTIVEPSAIDILLAMNPQLNPAPPVRQATEVWFKRPVLVGRAILQGRYVIEHDNERMARGEPCTHIYAYNDRTTPVVTFHCTHLERDRAPQNVAVLATASDPNMQTLTEFQFAGETFAHGYPTGR